MQMRTGSGVPPVAARRATRPLAVRPGLLGVHQPKGLRPLRPDAALPGGWHVREDRFWHHLGDRVAAQAGRGPAEAGGPPEASRHKPEGPKPFLHRLKRVVSFLGWTVFVLAVSMKYNCQPWVVLRLASAALHHPACGSTFGQASS